MKNTFLSISFVYWLIILTALYNLSNSSTLGTKYLWVFFVFAVILYAILFIVSHIITRYDKKVLAETPESSEKLIYYESKIQYKVVTTVLLILFLLVTLFDVGGFANVSIYFLVMSAVALVFLFFYQTSSFEITGNSLTWKRGKLKISVPWSDVIAVHYDWAPSIANAPRRFKTTNFFIETKSGMTAYADKASIKLRGVYTFASMGDQLVAEIKKRSSAVEKTGAVSMFKQTQKLKDVILLPLAIFLVPLIIIAIYFLVYGPL